MQPCFWASKRLHNWP